MDHSDINAAYDVAWEQAVAREVVIRRLTSMANPDRPEFILAKHRRRSEAIGKGEDLIDILTRRVQTLSKNPVHRCNVNFEGERADLGRVRP
jgi:hypothetical protein